MVDYLRRFSINYLLTTTHPSHISEAYFCNEETHRAIDFYEACIKHLAEDNNKLVITSVFFKLNWSGILEEFWDPISNIHYTMKDTEQGREEKKKAKWEKKMGKIKV